MKKWLHTAAIMLLCLVVGLGVAACAGGEADFSYAKEYEENGITLDRYDELELLPVEGEKEGITLTSGNTSIVSVSGNTLIAEGEGTTEITAERNGKKKTLNVRVYDTGARLNIAADSTVVYINNETDLGVHIAYNGKNYAYGSDFELKINDETKAEVRGVKIFGKAEGEITVSASLKGYKGVDEVKGSFKAQVRPETFVEVEENEITLYNAKDSRLAVAKIEPTVHYRAEKQENARVNFAVTAGSDKVTVSEDGTVTATKEGNATVRVTYAEDETAFADVNITVMPNYIDASFTATGAAGSKLEKYTGDETIGGRTKEDGILSYTAGNNSDSLWDYRIINTEQSLSVVEAARKGYRYFAFDVFYTSNGVMYVGMDHTDCQFINVGEYFRCDYLKIINEEGKEVDRLTKNEWLTFAYDLNYYVEKYTTEPFTGFFYTCGTANNVSYLDNVCWYLDDEYYDKTQSIKFEKKDGYVSASNDEFQIMDKMYWDNDTLVEIGAEYGLYGEEVDGVTGAYRYSPSNKKTNWENRLVLSSSVAHGPGVSPSTSSASTGMTNLTSGIAARVGETVSDSADDRYKFVTFDMYVENGKAVSISLNHATLGGRIELGEIIAGGSAIDGGTDLSTLSGWLRAWEKGSDKLSYAFENGKWYTVCLNYFDNFDLSAWSSNIYLSAYNDSDVIYVNDIRYYKSMEGVAPTEYAGLRPVSGLSMWNSTKANGGILSWGEGDFDGAVKFSTTSTDSNYWDYGSVRIDGVWGPTGANKDFFDNNYKYVSAEIYLDGGISKFGVESWFTHGTNGVQGDHYVAMVRPGQTTTALLYTTDGIRVVGNAETGKWYKIFIPVDWTQAYLPQWGAAIFELTATESNTASVYVRDIGFSEAMPNTLKDLTWTKVPSGVIEFTEGDTVELEVSVSGGIELEWTTSNPELATVDDNGVVTLHKSGEFTVTVTAVGYPALSRTVTIVASDCPEPTGQKPQLNGAATSTFTWITDGEFKGSWKHETKGNAGLNAKTNLQFLSGTDAQEANAAYYTIEVNFGDNVKKVGFNSTLNGKNYAAYAGCTVGTRAGGTGLAFFDSEGNYATTVSANTWYTILLPIAYYKGTGAASGWLFMEIESRIDNAAETAIYFRNPQFTDTAKPYYISLGANSSYDVVVGNTKQLTATVAPTGTEVVWSSSNDGIATVDQNGLVTAVAEGTVTITAKAKTQEKLSASVTVNVVGEPWHFDDTTTVKQTEGEFAGSYKFTGKNMIVANVGTAAANAQYITVEMYFAEATQMNFHSNMYTNNVQTWWWSWGTQLDANMKDCFFDMDGNKVTSITTGVWYKIILPKVKENNSVTWGNSAIQLVDSDTGTVYFRNVQFGDTLPDGWVNA